MHSRSLKGRWTGSYTTLKTRISRILKSTPTKIPAKFRPLKNLNRKKLRKRYPQPVPSSSILIWLPRCPPLFSMRIFTKDNKIAPWITNLQVRTPRMSQPPANPPPILLSASREGRLSQMCQWLWTTYSPPCTISASQKSSELAMDPRTCYASTPRPKAPSN
jgi:hypothetical protein